MINFLHDVIWSIIPLIRIYELYYINAYLLTGRLKVSDDSDEFFVNEDPSSVLNDAALSTRI